MCDTISVKESLHSSDIVFKGKVISTIITNNLSQYGIKLKGDTNSVNKGWLSNPMLVSKITVKKIFKGKNIVDTINIVTPAISGGCGFIFIPEEDYIIYATVDDMALEGSAIYRFSTSEKTFFTDVCTRTTKWNYTEESQIEYGKNSNLTPH